MVRQIIDRFRRQAQRFLAAGYQIGGSHRVAASKKCDCMPKPDQFLGQPGDHSFRSAVHLRWDALIKRCDLSNSHWLLLRSSGEADNRKNQVCFLSFLCDLRLPKLRVCESTFYKVMAEICYPVIAVPIARVTVT